MTVSKAIEKLSSVMSPSYVSEVVKNVSDNKMSVFAAGRIYRVFAETTKQLCDKKCGMTL